MGKCMPKSALPRNHEKHPSGLQTFYIARKYISQQLDTVKSRLKYLYASEDNIREAILPHVEWLNHPPVSTNGRLPHFVKALQNAIAMPMQSYVVFRSLQQEVNQLRKSISAIDASICCCRGDHLIQEIIALGDIIKLNLMTAFRCNSILVDMRMGDEMHTSEDESEIFWSKVEKIDKNELFEKDKLLSIVVDTLRPSCCILDQYDAFVALIGHLSDNCGELDRFEQTRFHTILEYVNLYEHLKECSIVLSQGKSCTTSWGDCGVARCGLHGFLQDMALGGPMLFATEESSSAELAAAMASQFFNSSQKLVKPAQLWDATVRYAEEACVLHGINSTKGLARFGPDRTRWIHGQTCNPYGMIDAGTVVNELLDFLKTTSRTASNSIQKSKAWYISTPLPDPYNISDPCSINVAIANRRRNGPEAHVLESCYAPSTSEDSVKSASQAGNPNEPTTLTKIPALYSTTENGVHRKRKSKNTRHPPREMILNKYHQRGYGQGHTETQQTNGAATKDINQRIWIIDNPTIYYEVWRVIFPLSKDDRLISRVSWRLFKQAIQSPPINCRPKKAQDPIFVWERDNGSGGMEVFQCHAPHALDWIPASDLYRYRKDLRDTFGMDADRIRLRGKKYEETGNICGARP